MKVKLTIRVSKAYSLLKFPYLAQEHSMTGKQLSKEKRTGRTVRVSYVSCGKCFNGNRRNAAAPGSWQRTSGS
jgi:hypothetical protein